MKRARYPGIYLRGETWSYVVGLPRSPDGRRRQEWRSGFRTQTGAHKARLARLAELGRGEGVGERLTLSALIGRWLLHAERDCRPRTIEAYRDEANRHLIPALGSIRIDRLSAYHVEEYLRQKGSTLGPRTLAIHHTILRQSLRRAVRWGLLPRNVAELVDRPSGTAPTFPILTPEQTRRLLDATRGEWIHVPVLLAVAAGLRIGEVLALRWKDIDGSALTVRRTLRGKSTFGPPKGGAEKVVQLPAGAAQALRALPRPFALVCPDLEGRPVPAQTCRRFFYAALAQAGLPRVRFHDLRHGCGSAMLSAGVTVKAVQERLRHADPMTTMRVYAHLLPGDEERATESLETAFGLARVQQNGANQD